MPSTARSRSWTMTRASGGCASRASRSPATGRRLAAVAAGTGARLLVIAIARASGSVIRDLTAQAEACGLIPKVIPSVKELLGGAAAIDGVRDPRISELLGRQPVETDVAAVASYFTAKRILVTGAGGSIGSELCRQLHHLNPARADPAGPR